MNYWLLKSEPTAFSIDDFKKVKIAQWDGVRNYQARNYLQSMQVGDEFLFYHSSAEAIGVAGIGKIKKTAYPDTLQFDKKDDHFEPRATKEKPVWFAPDVGFVEKFEPLITLQEIRKNPALSEMVLLRRGSRLSVQPVTKQEFDLVIKMAGK